MWVGAGAATAANAAAPRGCTGECPWVAAGLARHRLGVGRPGIKATACALPSLAAAPRPVVPFRLAVVVPPPPLQPRSPRSAALGTVSISAGESTNSRVAID